MPHIAPPYLNDADQAEHIQLAVEQSAMHTAHLAIARWSGGYCHCDCDAQPGSPLSSQSRWHATTQNNFTVWLAAGGFSQGEPEPEPEPLPAPDRADAGAAELPGVRSCVCAA